MSVPPRRLYRWCSSLVVLSLVVWCTCFACRVLRLSARSRRTRMRKRVFCATRFFPALNPAGLRSRPHIRNQREQQRDVPIAGFRKPDRTMIVSAVCRKA
eukprot:12503852-Alexandrium_andersonii.AAC.1